MAATLAVENLAPEQCRGLVKEMWEFKALAALCEAATERIPERAKMQKNRFWTSLFNH